MKHILPFLVLIGVLLIISGIISNLLNYSLKKRIVDAGSLDENAVNLLNRISGANSQALKWAIILFAGGLGLVVLEFLPYSFENSLLPYGVESIFLAAGFLAYYFVIKREKA
jgi:hypothetical protein